MMKNLLFTTLAIFLMVGVVSALDVSCTPGTVTVTATEGEIFPTPYITCQSDNSTQITILGSFFDVEDESNPFTLNGQKTRRLLFDESLSPGTYTGYVSYDGGSSEIILTVEEKTISGSCSIDVFPTILSNIKVQQGEIKTKTIQVSIPSCYPSDVKINGITLATDSQPIQLGELSLGKLSPGSSVNIPLEINAVGISTGTYSDILQFLMYDDFGARIDVPSVSISVLTSQGINPITNFSLSDLPTCSLSATELNLNDTYSLTCSVTNPNIKVVPVIDSDYLIGQSVEESSSQYLYKFKATQIGQTKFKVTWEYQSASIGVPYIQDLKISPSGNSPIQGTDLKPIFYQNGKKKDILTVGPGETTMLVVDNKTESTVSNYKIYLNGIQTNNTFTLTEGVTYDLRISAPGFLDFNQEFIPIKTSILITISPIKTFYDIGDIINITSELDDVIIIVDGVIKQNPYYITNGGNITIELAKEGYTNSNKTIYVNSRPSYKSMNIELDEWKRGKDIAIELDKSTNWSVYFDGNLLETNESNLVQFEIGENGMYQIKTGDYTLLSKEVEGRNFKFWEYDWIKNLGWWWIVILGLLGAVGYFFFFTEDEPTDFTKIE